MTATTKRMGIKIMGIVAALLFVGFASSCSKKLMPPEVESAGGAQVAGGTDTGGFSESGVGEEAGAGEGAGLGAPGEGFNIQEQPESAPGGGFFVEEGVGESGTSMGSGSGPDISAGSEQGFGSSGRADIGNGSDGFFASPGVGGGAGSGMGGAGSGMAGAGSGMGGAGSGMGGAGSGMGGAGSGMAGAGSGMAGAGSGMAGAGSGMGGAGSGMGGAGSGGGFGAGTQEARLQDFRESDELKDIHFAFDKYDLTEESKKILRANAEWLKSNPGARIEIQGHCDERGTNNYNLGLGERRALSTKKFLVALGVDESRIYTISYGEEKPFCFESNESCWWKNRRAHFMVAQ